MKKCKFAPQSLICLIYYLIHIVINIVFLIAFRAFINLHILSVVPVFLIVLMLFHITMFKTDTKNDTLEDTGYSVGSTVRLIDEEQACQYLYLKHSFLLCVPFEIPLIFFLPSYLKLIGILPYIFAHILGALAFKRKMGKEIKKRINAEKKELEEQIKREELGLK